MNKYLYLLLLGAGLLIHLGSIPLLQLDPLDGDARQFYQEAENIKNGIGWINTEGPGQATATYPSQVIFLLICKYIFGDYDIQGALVLQHLLVLATALIVFKVAMLLFNSRKVAILASSIIIFFPHMIYYSNILYSHILGMFLSVISIYLLMKNKIKTYYYPVIGALWAAATMARFTFQFFVPLYLVISGFFIYKTQERNRLKAALKPLLFLAGFLILMLPWQLRVASSGAGNYGYSGIWEIAYKYTREPRLRGNPRDDFQIELSKSNLPVSEQEEIYRRKVLENITEHPAWFINNCLTNITYLTVNLSKNAQRHMAVYTGIYYSMLIGFGLIGFISMGGGRIRQYTPAIILFIVIFGVHVPIYGYMVNSFPLWALFSPLAAQGIFISLTAAGKYRNGIHNLNSP